MVTAVLIVDFDETLLLLDSRLVIILSAWS